VAFQLARCAHNPLRIRISSVLFFGKKTPVYIPPGSKYATLIEHCRIAALPKYATLIEHCRILRHCLNTPH
jgi:hypothetical protein